MMSSNRNTGQPNIPLTTTVFGNKGTSYDDLMVIKIRAIYQFTRNLQTGDDLVADDADA